MRLFIFALLLTVFLPCQGYILGDLYNSAFRNDGSMAHTTVDLCHNNGIRIVDGADSRCQCVNGWSGKSCNECLQGVANNEICHSCAGVTCMNNGTCMASPDGISCVCEWGFKGEICEFTEEAEETTLPSTSTSAPVLTTVSETTSTIASVPASITAYVLASTTASVSESTTDSTSASVQSSTTASVSTSTATSEAAPTSKLPKVTTTTVTPSEVTIDEPTADIPIVEINLTSSGLSPSAYLEKLRVYTNISIEFASDSNGHAEVCTITTDDEHQIEPNATTVVDSFIIANVTVDFSNCASECRISTLDDFTDFLNSPEAPDVIGVPSVTATVLRKKTPTSDNSYLVFIVILVLISSVAGISRFRRPVVVKTFYTPEGLPQYHPKAGTPIPVPSEVTPLHDALRRSVEPLGVITEDWMQLLSTIDVLGQTPIHAAVDAVAEKPEAAIMADLDLLITPETKIDQRDNAGNTALHLAIKCGRPEVVAYLLERGADPNAYGPHGTTPLSMAIMGESLDCLKTLMKHKDINPNIAIVPEDTPLKMCIMRGPAFNAYIDVLLENPKTSVKAIGHLQTGICRSPIHVAVTARNLYALEQLMKRQANLTVKDRQKKTPLLLAIETEALDIAKILIRNIKVNNFYEPNPLLSPIEQAKTRKMHDVLKWMKEAEVEEAKPKQRKRAAKSTPAGSTAAKKPRKTKTTDASSTAPKKTKPADVSSSDSGFMSSPSTSFPHWNPAPAAFQQPMNNQYPSLDTSYNFQYQPMTNYGYQQPFSTQPAYPQSFATPSAYPQSFATPSAYPSQPMPQFYQPPPFSAAPVYQYGHQQMLTTPSVNAFVPNCIHNNNGFCANCNMTYDQRFF
uniref:ANK_REP_REGION domain-containing protein n=1 Tax=Panagrellus redivivus TaxID=6233 RepID=A0A7E4W7X6_PANRE